MKEKILFLFIIELLCSYVAALPEWRDFPACNFGRLQSPIEIYENESIYANNFSFVYQSYSEGTLNNINNEHIKSFSINGGYINFERGGVIKQYQFERVEIHQGIHSIDGESGDYELHLIHKKNLDFITNKNQYRNIQDASMYLVIVLRYKEKDKCKKECISDDGLLDKIKGGDNLNLNEYPVFQDKRAYFYEGSSLYIPCDENYIYYIVKDFFYSKNTQSLEPTYKIGEITPQNKYGRPVYKNFMNYKEVLKSNFMSARIVVSFLLIFLLF